MLLCAEYHIGLFCWNLCTDLCVSLPDLDFLDNAMDLKDRVLIPHYYSTT